MNSAEMDAVTALRLKLRANGWVPLPNFDKRIFFKGWTDVDVTDEEVKRWGRKHKRFGATGLRIENGICVIDFDIDDRMAMTKIANRIFKRIAKLGDPATPLLVRTSGKAKEAWFVRTKEEFGRMHSRGWTKPGETVEQAVNFVEIFGGASARQFGAFAAHTKLDDGTVVRTYEWADRSPLDTRVDELPELTKDELREIVAIVETTLHELGWSPVLRSKTGENASLRVRDLTEDMVFDCDDGVTRTLADLKELARSVGSLHLRCSANWLHGPSAKRTDRCIIGATGNGCLTIWETASGITHMPKPVEIDMYEVAAKIGRVRELYNARQ